MQREGRAYVTQVVLSDGDARVPTPYFDAHWERPSGEIEFAPGRARIDAALAWARERAEMVSVIADVDGESRQFTAGVVPQTKRGVALPGWETSAWAEPAGE